MGPRVHTTTDTTVTHRVHTTTDTTVTQQRLAVGDGAVVGKTFIELVKQMWTFFEALF